MIQIYQKITLLHAESNPRSNCRFLNHLKLTLTEDFYKKGPSI